MGFCTAIGRIGGMLGPTIGGFRTAANASLTACFLTFAIPMFIAVFVVSLTKENVTD